ncbi:lariat debranching enzyme A-like [Antedon mediterranea]|uniref:lariat debranching enzyme A-like n=1 Tax=Antedon mediterranea TaxID=105859 RepID=UPI003AF582D1
MKVAVEGCAHGELDKIYETIQYIEKKEDIKVDLLLCCGDFQSVRNEADLQCMAVPDKYKTMNSFYKYYSGEKKAPILTLFIGGNHEASNYLQELPYGGWVAPNIYYFGYANVLNYGGLRIAGLSGIYKQNDYKKGHFERPPYNRSTSRSAYHIRNLEVFRLKQLNKSPDIILSHDWPRGVYHHGNKNKIFRFKPFMKEEIETTTLGSPPSEELLHFLQPEYWFSAHLHIKFPAIVRHQNSDGREKKTKFLALDKCLPRRQFLQILDIPCKEDEPYTLCYDVEWLAILQLTNGLLTASPNQVHMPAKGYNAKYDYSVTEDQIEAARKAMGDSVQVPDNFTKTASAYNPANSKGRAQQPSACVNPQTTEFCANLGLTDPFYLIDGDANSMPDDNVAEISINDDFIDDTILETSVNPDEISLEEEEDDDDDDDDDDEDDDDEDDDDVEDDDDKVKEVIEEKKILFLEDEFKDEEEEILAAIKKRDDSKSCKNPLLLDSSSDVILHSEVDSDIGNTTDTGKTSADTDTDHSTSSSLEKFKRRNESIYSSQEEDTDHTDSHTETSSSSTSPGAKKFKRRNVSMYENKDEDM